MLRALLLGRIRRLGAVGLPRLSGLTLRSRALRLTRCANEVASLALLQRLTYLADLSRRSSAVLRIDLTRLSETARVAILRVAALRIELAGLSRRAARSAD